MPRAFAGSSHAGVDKETAVGDVSVRVGQDGLVEVYCSRPATRDEKIRNPGMRSIDQVVRIQFGDGEPKVATSSCGSD